MTQASRFGGKRILVACDTIVVAGGLYRFERFGRVIQRFGHTLSFMAFQDAHERETEFPVLNFEQAARETWDITMVPGSGFCPMSLARLGELTSPSFGLRVQHILNDQTRKLAFVDVNHAFRPDIVVFNNRHWRPGEFTDLNADAFYFLEGAVDVENVAPDPRGRYRTPSANFVVGGIANKNAEPLIAAARLCHEAIELHLFGEAGSLAQAHPDLLASGRLRLFGVLGEQNLPDFYAGLDCVVHTEKFAGWANLAAEGMAAGVPVICTPHGTGAFATHEATALIVSDPTPEALAAAIERLRGDRALAAWLVYGARKKIQEFSWTAYAGELLQLMRPPGAKFYTWAPDLGLFGKWPEADRLAGLEPLLDASAGSTICDLGSSEGVIARRLLERGAALVHGFEQDSSRVRLATRLCAGFSGAFFWEADLSSWFEFEAEHASHLLDRYDVVLYLGLHHHLPASSRMATLAAAAGRTSDWLAIRTPSALFDADRIGPVLEASGFDRVAAQNDHGDRPLGGSYLYRRGHRR